MKLNYKKWSKFVLRWGIAVLGISWVLAKTSFHDHVLVLDKKDQATPVRIEDGESNVASQFWAFYDGKREYPIARANVWTPPGDQRSVPIALPDGKKENAKVLAIHQFPDQQRNQPPSELLVQDPRTGKPWVIKPSQVIGGYTVRVVYPLIDIGLIRLVREACPLYLLLAVALLPISFLVTSIR